MASVLSVFCAKKKSHAILASLIFGDILISFPASAFTRER